METLTAMPLAKGDRAEKPHPRPRLRHFIARFGVFHRIKHIKLHDNMTQIILPSKINCIDTSDEIH